MNKNIRFMAEAGVMIALAAVLAQIPPIFEMPQGGSVKAGVLLPLLLIAFRWGFVKGVIVGVLFGLLKMILPGAYVLTPIQAILDYPLAYGCVGLAGLAAKKLKEVDLSVGVFYIIGFGALAMIFRWFFHVLSGVIFFSEYAGSQNPWLYSIGYNATLLPEFGISLFLVVLLWKPLIRNIPAARD